MPKFKVYIREVCDYTFEIEATDAEEARQLYGEGTETFGETVESEVVGIELV